MRRAYRLVDRALVVVKFIFKHKVSTSTIYRALVVGQVHIHAQGLYNILYRALLW